MQAGPCLETCYGCCCRVSARRDGGGRLCANVAVERVYNCATGTASSPVVCACTVRGLMLVALCQLSKLTDPASSAVHACARQCGDGVGL
jgi:hypothetical protein